MESKPLELLQPPYYSCEDADLVSFCIFLLSYPLFPPSLLQKIRRVMGHQGDKFTWYPGAPVVISVCRIIGKSLSIKIEFVFEAMVDELIRIELDGCE